MIYKVIFSDEAVDTFDAIKEQLRARWGESIVAEFEQRTWTVVELIEKTPFIFPATTQDENVRKGFIHKNCSMLYEVRSTVIEIFFFWDNRQEPIF